MSRFPALDIRFAEWDRFRGAVIIPCGRSQVAITIEALEDWANRSLSPEEAVNEAVEDAAMWRAIANATPAHDDIIMITKGILNSRSWSAEPYDDGPDDSGPIYLSPNVENSQ